MSSSPPQNSSKSFAPIPILPRSALIISFHILLISILFSALAVLFCFFIPEEETLAWKWFQDFCTLFWIPITFSMVFGFDFIITIGLMLSFLAMAFIRLVVLLVVQSTQPLPWVFKSQGHGILVFLFVHLILCICLFAWIAVKLSLDPPRWFTRFCTYLEAIYRDMSQSFSSDLSRQRWLFSFLLQSEKTPEEMEKWKMKRQKFYDAKGKKRTIGRFFSVRVHSSELSSQEAWGEPESKNSIKTNLSSNATRKVSPFSIQSSMKKYLVHSQGSEDTPNQLDQQRYVTTTEASHIQSSTLEISSPIENPTQPLEDLIMENANSISAEPILPPPTPKTQPSSNGREILTEIPTLENYNNKIGPARMYPRVFQPLTRSFSGAIQKKTDMEDVTRSFPNLSEKNPQREKLSERQKMITDGVEPSYKRKKEKKSPSSRMRRLSQVIFPPKKSTRKVTPIKPVLVKSNSAPTILVHRRSSTSKGRKRMQRISQTRNSIQNQNRRHVALLTQATKRFNLYTFGHFRKHQTSGKSSSSSIDQSISLGSKKGKPSMGNPITRFFSKSMHDRNVVLKMKQAGVQKTVEYVTNKQKIQETSYLALPIILSSVIAVTAMVYIDKWFSVETSTQLLVVSTIAPLFLWSVLVTTRFVLSRLTFAHPKTSWLVLTPMIMLNAILLRILLAGIPGTGNRTLIAAWFSFVEVLERLSTKFRQRVLYRILCCRPPPWDFFHPSSPKVRLMSDSMLISSMLEITGVFTANGLMVLVSGGRFLSWELVKSVVLQVVIEALSVWILVKLSDKSLGVDLKREWKAKRRHYVRGVLVMWLVVCIACGNLLLDISKENVARIGF